MSNETIPVTINLHKLPEGWEYTGEYRVPKYGEYYYPYLDDVQLVALVADNIAKNPKHLVRKKRWRADFSEPFYSITECNGKFHVVVAYDHRTPCQNHAWENGNYFRTEAEALEVVDKFHNILKERIT